MIHRYVQIALCLGLPGCVVQAALLRIPRSGHHVELFQYVEPPGEAHRPRPCDPGSWMVPRLLSVLTDGGVYIGPIV